MSAEATYRIEIFHGQAKPRRWHFRIVEENGQVVAGSTVGDGYSRKRDCINTVAHLRGALIGAGIFENGKELVDA